MKCSHSCKSSSNSLTRGRNWAKRVMKNGVGRAIGVTRVKKRAPSAPVLSTCLFWRQNSWARGSGGKGGKRERWRTEKKLKVLRKALPEAHWYRLGPVSLPSSSAWRNLEKGQPTAGSNRTNKNTGHVVRDESSWEKPIIIIKQRYILLYSFVLK